MNKGGSSKVYQASIKDGQYPFKSAQLFKIFDLIVFQQLSIDPKIIHKLLQAYHEIKNPILISILNINTNSQSKLTKIQYQYVETSLYTYIRRFLHQNIQIKIEKLLIQIRDLAHRFVTKKINVLNAISCKNIGVKMKDIYRQTMFVGGYTNNNEKKKNNKDIVMPDFKIFIDFNKCEIIQRHDQIAKIAIETDKFIYKKLRAQIDALVRKAETTEHLIIDKNYGSIPTLFEVQSQKNLPSGNLFYCNSSAENIIPESNFQFSKNLKKRKKKVVDKKLNQQVCDNSNKQTQIIQIVDNIEAISPKDNKQEVSYNRKQNNELFKSSDLANKVDLVVQRSRRVLQTFRKTIKLYQ